MAEIPSAFRNLLSQDLATDVFNACDIPRELGMLSKHAPSRSDNLSCLSRNRRATRSSGGECRRRHVFETEFGCNIKALRVVPRMFATHCQPSHPDLCMSSFLYKTISGIVKMCTTNMQFHSNIVKNWCFCMQRNGLAFTYTQWYGQQAHWPRGKFLVDFLCYGILCLPELFTHMYPERMPTLTGTAYAYDVGSAWPKDDRLDFVKQHIICASSLATGLYVMATCCPQPSRHKVCVVDKDGTLHYMNAYNICFELHTIQNVFTGVETTIDRKVTGTTEFQALLAGELASMCCSSQVHVAPRCMWHHGGVLVDVVHLGMAFPWFSHGLDTVPDISGQDAVDAKGAAGAAPRVKRLKLEISVGAQCEYEVGWQEFRNTVLGAIRQCATNRGLGGALDIKCKHDE